MVDERINVPFLGKSWLHMVLEVQFQLFTCFALYALFIVFVIRNYTTALEDWKNISDGRGDLCVKKSNAEFFSHVESIMKKRVQNTPEYRQLFHNLKLRFPGVAGLDAPVPGGCDFELHLYLTDGLGKSVEHLIQVCRATNVFLACSALLMAVLALHFEVALMYFLPGFVFVGFLLFIVGYLVAGHFRKLADDDDHNTSAKYVTIYSYCRCIQICLYCLFFSFARLLLSNDIYEFYPNVYFSSVIGLALIIVFLSLLAGEIIKETACALILPPHLPMDQLYNNLQQIVSWHTIDKCEECGMAQMSTVDCAMSSSRSYASKSGSQTK